ncbi:hypothetical protein NDU88_003047 [Pleurodeles waltl]|uniref:Uncharacterized protein n=1 Tax=Pleurodeles waltl TaxID=8319 RepID=A0AAV7KWE8_PLEWA|nr:hypothetical protein NDU88_003047 [Pleurodeles waltl]
MTQLRTLERCLRRSAVEGGAAAPLADQARERGNEWDRTEGGLGIACGCDGAPPPFALLRTFCKLSQPPERPQSPKQTPWLRIWAYYMKIKDEWRSVMIAEQELMDIKPALSTAGD